MTTTKTAPRKNIIGNTYPCKEQLKAMGARWNAVEKCWSIEASKFDSAMAIVNAAGPKAPYSGGNRSSAPRSPRGFGGRTGGRYECEECGDRVMPGTQCWETGVSH